MKVFVMAGLPASGKTTLAKKIVSRENSNVYRTNVLYISLDLNSDLDSQLNNTFGINNLVIDGLLLTNKDYLKVRDMVCNHYPNKNPTFEFHYFVPNREACLNNDEGRRSEGSKITIMNAEVEEPNRNLLSTYKDKKLQVKVITHEIYVKDSFDKFKEQHNIGEYIDGETWSRGGNHCNCWGDDYEISADTPPYEHIDNFPELNIFIDEICFGIDNDLKQEFFEKTVFIEDTSESDWYGGTEYKSHFRCDLRKLYELMDEKELIVLGQITK